MEQARKMLVLKDTRRHPVGFQQHTIVFVKDDNIYCAKCLKHLPQGSLAIKEISRTEIMYSHEECWKKHRNPFCMRRKHLGN